ncbi:MAG: adenine-specific methyltransferase EcoRI family protein [Candidatus Cloacimonetes bacterium]|nr:adenine-specific methyltransferase EcoRI family protein [Candidatus Cloacimonadota bacterium]
MTQKHLNTAKINKADEFYTQMTDIDKEMKYYKALFKNQIIFCNCDDPYESNFFKFFAMSFNHLGLKKLIATCYDGSPIASTQLTLFDYEPPENKTTKNAHKIVMEELTDENHDGATGLADVELILRNKKNVLTRLKGNGDFRSQECIELLKETDIVITNPPFSLLREYIAQLIEYDKRFIIIGNINAVSYKEIFKLIKENKLWLGESITSGDREFKVPDYYPLDAATTRIDENGNKYIRVKGVRWFTNIDVPRRHEKLYSYKKYTPEEFPQYDNFNAIEVSKVVDIPIDWDGIMGVPISFLDKYNPEQFKIVGNEETLNIPKGRCYINGKRLYARIFIKRLGDIK